MEDNFDLLSKKKNGKFAVLWDAAHQRRSSFLSNVTPRDIRNTNVPDLVDEIIQIAEGEYPDIEFPEGEHRARSFSLYLSSNLLSGACKVLNRQASFLLNDVSSCSTKLGDEMADARRLASLEDEAEELTDVREIMNDLLTVPNPEAEIVYNNSVDPASITLQEIDEPRASIDVEETPDEFYCADIPFEDFMDSSFWEKDFTVQPVQPEIAPLEPEVVPVQPEIGQVEPEVVPVQPEVVPVQPEVVPVQPEIVPVQPEVVPVQPAPALILEAIISPALLQRGQQLGIGVPKPLRRPARREPTIEIQDITLASQDQPTEVTGRAQPEIAQVEPEVVPEQPEIAQVEPEVVPLQPAVAPVEPAPALILEEIVVPPALVRRRRRRQFQDDVTELTAEEISANLTPNVHLRCQDPRDDYMFLPYQESAGSLFSASGRIGNLFRQKPWPTPLPLITGIINRNLRPPTHPIPDQAFLPEAEAQAQAVPDLPPEIPDAPDITTDVSVGARVSLDDVRRALSKTMTSLQLDGRPSESFLQEQMTLPDLNFFATSGTGLAEPTLQEGREVVVTEPQNISVMDLDPVPQRQKRGRKQDTPRVRQKRPREQENIPEGQVRLVEPQQEQMPRQQEVQDIIIEDQPAVPGQVHQQPAIGAEEAEQVCSGSSKTTTYSQPSSSHSSMKRALCDKILEELEELWAADGGREMVSLDELCPPSKFTRVAVASYTFALLSLQKSRRIHLIQEDDLDGNIPPLFIKKRMDDFAPPSTISTSSSSF